MLFDWLRKDRFPDALRAFGLHRCAMSGESLCIGLAPNSEYSLLPLQNIPAAPVSVCFFDAPLQADLVHAFVSSPRAATVAHLVIGTSHDYAKHRARGYDMTQAVAALKGTRLPMLKRLSLGDMEMLYNGHRLFGTIGDISHVFQIAPALTELRVHGHFTLAGPNRHPHLATLEVEVDDIGVTGGPLDQQTVSNLMLSDFPSLTCCDLDLSEDPPEVRYSIPPEFFSPQRSPLLRSLAINSLTAEAAVQLEKWKALRGIG
ncbi:hypothetical protein [Cypionkella sp.]|uniref:hypothetical protein n=1 Tax=Cypionkella sp. TaxID=2811411 RepID=UPI002AC89C78|nr:hypothetical protein [Cypionkella sp.]